MQDFFYKNILSFKTTHSTVYPFFQYGDNIYHLDHIVTAPFKFGIARNKKKKDAKKYERRTKFYRIKTPQGNIDNISLDKIANIKQSSRMFYN